METGDDMETLAQYLGKFIGQELDEALREGQLDFGEEAVTIIVRRGIGAYESTEGVTMEAVKTDKEIHGKRAVCTLCEEGFHRSWCAYLAAKGKCINEEETKAQKILKLLTNAYYGGSSIPRKGEEETYDRNVFLKEKPYLEAKDLLIQWNTEELKKDEQVSAPADGWIDVKDRFPSSSHHNLSEDVLAANNCSIDIACYDRDKDMWYVDAKEEWIDKITHWMPLPLNPHKKLDRALKELDEVLMAPMAPADDTGKLMKQIKEHLLGRIDKAEDKARIYGLALINIQDIEKSRWEKSCGYDQEVNDVVIEALIAGEAIDKKASGNS